MDIQLYMQRKDSMKEKKEVKQNSKLVEGLSYNYFFRNNPTNRFLTTQKSILAQSKEYAIKMREVIKKSDKEVNIKNEIEILEQLFYLPSAPKAFPEFYGHIKEKYVDSLNFNYMLIFRYYPMTLKKFLEEKVDNALQFDELKTCFFALLNAFTFLENMGYSHGNINSVNLMIVNESGCPCIKIIGWGNCKRETELLIKKDSRDLLLLLLEMAGIYKPSNLNLELSNNGKFYIVQKFNEKYANFNKLKENDSLFYYLNECLNKEIKLNKRFSELFLL